MYATPTAAPRLTGVMLLGADERVIYADPQIRSLLGMEGAGTPLSLAEAVPAEAAEAIRRAVREGEAGPLDLPGGSATLAASPLGEGAEPGHVVRVLQEIPVARASASATREALVNRVERALARARRRTDYTFGLLWIDYPHPAEARNPDEDDLRVVELLQDAVRPMDMAARLARGRFGVLLHGLNDEVDAFHVARRLHWSLHNGEDDGAARRAATGVVLSADATTADELLRQAEAASALGRWERSGVAAFEPRRHLRASQQLRVEEELPVAIAQGQLRLLYQPIVSVFEQRLVGFEALVRWAHPHDGLLLPDRFVPAAERAGLIAQLDLWTLAAASGQAARWRAGGVLPADGFVSVNLSGRTLDRDDTAELALSALQGVDLEPRFLQVEITETSLVERTDVANATLQRLRETGVRVAIDDFGSGYCSLAYLQRLPVDALKLDRSLLRGRTAGEGAYRLFEGVMALAKCMELPVTIEGVETRGDVAFLHDLKSGHAQGFAFAAPLDEKAAAAFRMPD